MLKFKMEIPKNYNFTPAGLIYMYCYMTGIELLQTKYNTKLVVFNNKYWNYDHYKINSLQDADEVTIFLTEYSGSFEPYPV